MTTAIQNMGNLFGGATVSENSFKSPLDMNAFLNMFLTQLKHQDPTNPMESYELAAQLAQFSSVERLSEINKNAVHQLNSLKSINYSQMIQMIGREVVGVDNGIQLHEGGTSRSSYELKVPANVTVKILSEEGSLIRSIPLGVQSSGTYDVAWDGKNNGGQMMPPGKYSVQVEARDDDGRLLQVEQSVAGSVHAFRLEQGKPYLVLDHEKGIRVPIAAVSQVSGPGTGGAL